MGGYTDSKVLKRQQKRVFKVDFAPFSVSLVNDGYHTFDGMGIRFLSPYIYSDFDIVTENGDIFAVNNKLSKITKCELNPVYY